MGEHDERDRRRAVERYLNGESPTAIGAALGYSRWWFYKWLRRFTTNGPDWFRERSRRPHTTPTRVAASVEQLVTSLREQLDEEGLFSGAQAIHWELSDLGVEPIP